MARQGTTKLRTRLAAALIGFAVWGAVAPARGDPNVAITITVRVVGPPHIDSLSASSGPGWSQIQIAGVFFGDTRGTSSVVFGAGQTESPEYLAWSDAAIVCRVPKGLPLGANDVQVIKETVPSNAVQFTVTDSTELCVDGSNTTGTETGSARWPFNTVGEAVEASTTGDAVKVAAGTYRETVSLASTILYLRGGYAGGSDYAGGGGDFGDGSRSLDLTANATILDGEGARRCVAFNGCPGGELSGFIVRRGAAADSGGGIRCVDSSPVVQACTIEANAAALDGGGVYCLNSTLSLSYTTIRGNTAGGAGGGVALDGGSGDVACNAIYGNQAVQGGGVCLSASSATLRSNVVTGNQTTGRGGGIAVRTSGSPGLAHNTIAHNRGGGVLCQNTVSPTLKHCILWGNEATSDPQLQCVAGATPTASYCNIQGGLPSGATDGGENMGEDPLFVSPGEWTTNAWIQGDYHLESEAGHWTPSDWVLDTRTSPCIDAGDLADGVGAEPSPNGGCRNLGAFGGTAQASKSPAVAVHVIAPDPSASETRPGDPLDTGLFRIRRIGRTGALTVNFIRLGTATFGPTGDYTLSVGGVQLTGTAVTIPDGKDDVDILLAPIDDALAEGTETAALALLAGTGYRLDPEPSKTMACVAILDNEESVSVVATEPNAAEPSTNGKFRIGRTGTSPANLTVTFARQGTASSGKDYTLRANGVTLSANSIIVPAAPGYVDVEVVVIGDVLGEGPETVVLSLVKSAACGLDPDPAKRAGTVTIQDDDPVVSIAATDPTGGEPSDSGMFRLSRSGGGPADLFVAFKRSGTATSGTDYTLRANGSPLATSTIAVPATPGYVDIEVAVIDDALAEGSEAAILTLAKGAVYGLDPNPARRSATVTIQDNEPAVAIAALQASVAEPSTTTAFRVSRANGGPPTLNVAFTRTGTAKSGTDYTLRANGALLAANTIPVPASPGYVDIDLVVPNDTLVEPTKMVVLTLVKGTTYGVDGASRSATVSIVGNMPTVSIAALDPAAAEPATPGLFRISRTNGGPASLPVAFKRSGTAKFTAPGVVGGDYTLFVGGTLLAATTVNVPASPGYVDIVLVPLDDTLVEPIETATLTLAAGKTFSLDPDPARRSAAVTIADDDGATGTGTGDGGGESKDTGDGDPVADGGIAILVVPNRGRAPLEVAATALGVDAGTVCEWDFGDKAKATGLCVPHTYWSPGTYTVTLRAMGQVLQATVVVE